MLDIDQLLNEQYMLDLLWEHKNILDFEPASFTKIKIKPIKYYNKEDFQHAVISYKLYYLDTTGEKQKMNIYASAHSDGSRARSFAIMEHIYTNGFRSKNMYASTKPLFFHQPLKAAFHKELLGENLVYIQEQRPEMLSELLSKAGTLIAKFHKLPLPQQPALAHYPLNDTGLDPTNILSKVGNNHPESKAFILTTYNSLLRFHKNNPALFPENIFSHGDLHLENIIIGANFKLKKPEIKTVGIIDYTDVCAGGRGLDVGMFTYKIRYMGKKKLGLPQTEIDTLVDLFLQSYAREAAITITKDLEQNILFWQTWNALKVIIFKMLFDEQETIALVTNDITENLTRLAIDAQPYE